MTLIIEPKNEQALRALEEMAQRGEITIQAPIAESTSPESARKFEAMSYSTKSFKFDRDEANKR